MSEPVEPETNTLQEEIADTELTIQELENDTEFDSPPQCCADGFGELDTDNTGQLRYVPSKTPEAHLHIEVPRETATSCSGEEPTAICVVVSLCPGSATVPCFRSTTIY